MRKNQKGFTLVELIIAVAILAIVTLAVCGFIVVGSRSYTSANTDIMLQQEAQLALNQISDVIIDTTDSINYSGKTATASEMQSVLKDSEFSGEPTEKCLAVVNTNDTTSNNTNPSYWFYWSKDDETIYFNEVHVDSSMSQSEIEAGFNNAAADKAILAQHVKELHIDISQFEENRVVMISMTFQNGNKEYTTSNNVTVRNRVALNKIDIEPMKKAHEFTITTVKNVTLEPNDTYSLPYTVESNATDPGAKDVRWEMVGGPLNGSSISAEGRLTIGREETRESFSVRVVRVNEEYVNQNAKVAKTVKVRIKRVNTVNLSCSETTIKAGNTVTVNGNASGYMLGSKCNGEGCATDDVSKDHDLVSTIGAAGWTIVRGPATVETADSKKAEIKILTTAKKGDEIEIEARAILPDKKSYGPVTGRLILKVTEGASGAKFIGSDLKFGTDNDPGIFDYMRTSLRTDHGRYVFCVRVREAGTVGCQNDQVMLYFTQGANERFSPDAFGLDHTKSYEIYFQVLDPRPKGSSVEASKGQIEQEYLGNLDDNGKYIGNMFDADEYYYAVLNQPSVAVTVNGVTYPNDERDRYVRCSLLSVGPGSSIMGIINIADNGAINIWDNAVKNSLGYTIYKEDANGTWKRVYGFAYDTEDSLSQVQRTGTSRIGALDPNLYIKDYSGTSQLGAVVFQPQGSDPTIKRENGDVALSSGIYHIVPGFLYANDPCIRPGAYVGDNVIYKKVNGDYQTYYYKQWDCVINLKIDAGLNLQLPDGKDWAGQNEERWTNFPVPSDRAFPFDLRSETKQEISYNFSEYSKNGEWKGSRSDVTVTCEYNGQRDVYLLTLSSKEVNAGERKIITHIYGKYESKMGQDNWTRVGLEDTKVTNIQTNLEFIKENTKYEAYFPTPNDAEFPSSDAFTSNREIKDWQLISFSKDGSNNALLEKCIVKCSKPGDAYEIEIITENPTINNPHKKYVYTYGKFTWDNSTKSWIRTDDGSNFGVETAVWGNLIYFTMNGTAYKMEIPLPSEKGFSNLGNDGHMQFFLATDTYGDQDMYLYTDWRGITLDYSYDVNTDTYTLKLSPNWGQAISPSTWKCTSKGTQWK